MSCTVSITRLILKPNRAMNLSIRKTNNMQKSKQTNKLSEYLSHPRRSKERNAACGSTASTNVIKERKQE